MSKNYLGLTGLTKVFTLIKGLFDDLASVAKTGSYNDLSDKPTIPAAQVQSDWNQTDTTAVDYIKNKPTGSCHTIWNAIKTALTQRTKLWFADAKVTDDTTEQATKVEVVQLIDDESELTNAPDGVYQGDYEDVPEVVLDASMMAYRDGTVEDALDGLNDKVVYVNDSTTFTLPSVGNSVDVQKAVSLSGYGFVGIINVSPNTAKVAIGTFVSLSNGNAFMSFINIGNSSQAGQSRNATWTNVFVKQ